MSAALCPFTTPLLLLDPTARLVYADWLEEHDQPAKAPLWRRLGQVRLSAWTVANLRRRLRLANEGVHRGPRRRKRLHCRLDLHDCLLAALEATIDPAPVGCFCVHGGGVQYGSGRLRYTTVCLAVRKPDGTVAVDVGEARARNEGGTPANIWPQLKQFRPGTRPCQERLLAWAAQR
jgi:uncharacterized protein (TIGR02996 family)